VNGVDSVAREERRERARQVAVEQDAHARWLGGRCDQRSFRELENCDGVLARDAWVIVEKLVERMAGLDVVDQGVDRDARPGENRRAAEALDVTRYEGYR